jgi:hypothetical protein
MNDPADNVIDIMPSATPSKEELRKWEMLPRDEQLRRLRAVLLHPDCAAASTDSMSDILAAARATIASRRG